MHTPWTADRIEELARLWADGFSASQIATRLGNTTRNAVMGKVHRLGLSARIQRRQARIRLPARSPQRAPEHTVRPWRPTPRPLTIPQSDQSALLLSILDLKSCSCRWPYGDPLGEFGGFCGRQVRPGSSYCPHHHRKAYR